MRGAAEPIRANEACLTMQSSRSSILLLEYERSSEFCNHVDDVRNVITSFFLTVAGVAVLAVDRFSSGDLKSGPLGSPALRAMFVLLAVSLLGFLFVLVISRLRRVQLERYSIMNGILDTLLEGDDRGLIPFTNSNIPGQPSAAALRRRATGSYFWTLILVLPSASLLGIACAIGLSILSAPGIVTGAAGVSSGVAYAVLCDGAYFRFSR
jgi:hypothetical protein